MKSRGVLTLSLLLGLALGVWSAAPCEAGTFHPASEGITPGLALAVDSEQEEGSPASPSAAEQRQSTEGRQENVPGAAPDFRPSLLRDARLSEVLGTSKFAQTFFDWAKNFRLNQGGTLWIALLVTLLVAFDFDNLRSRRNLDLLLLMLPGIFIVNLVTLGSNLEDVSQAVLFKLLFMGLFLSTVLLFALALRRAFDRNVWVWSPNLSRRVLAALAILLFAINCFLVVSRNPDDAGLYTNLGAARMLETGRFPYGDPTLRGGAAATYGPVLYVAHMPLLVVLAPAVSLIESRDIHFLRRVVIGAPAYTGPPQLATKLTLILFHLLGVAALVTVGTRLATREVGWGLACLYMGSAYVNGLGGEGFYITGITYMSHIAPMALTTLAFLALSRPWAGGALLATAAGALYYPAFFFPLWTGYLFWKRGKWRDFVIGFSVVCLVILLFVFLLTDSQGEESTLRLIYESTVGHQESRDAYGASLFSFWATQPTLAALWQKQLVPGWYLFKPSFLCFAALLIGSFFMARGRSMTQLALLTAAVAIAVQLWKSHAGGSYVEWYYAFLLIGLFAQRKVTTPDETAVPVVGEAEQSALT